MRRIRRVLAVGVVLAATLGSTNGASEAIARTQDPGRARGHLGVGRQHEAGDDGPGRLDERK